MPQVPIWGTLKTAITESVWKSETLNLFRCSRQGLRVVGLSLRRLHENMEFLLIWLWVVTDQSGDWSHSALQKQDCTKIVHKLECAHWICTLNDAAANSCWDKEHDSRSNFDFYPQGKVTVVVVEGDKLSSFTFQMHNNWFLSFPFFFLQS